MSDRREFLVGVGAVGAGLLTGCAQAPPAAPKRDAAAKKGKEEDEVSPTEDLMREHGVLDRILLVYEESARRMEVQQPFPVEALASGADLLRRFIGQYHEKLEEDFLFTRLEKANTLVPLVATLRRQHVAGRALTDTIVRVATAANIQNPAERAKLLDAMRSFIRMYRPHAAREDTVLFPAFRKLVTEKELEALGEMFERTEHELFGSEGFEGIVKRVVELEQALGIDALERFTPT
jgi:hemerythrin-like domain-containing protein